MIDYASNGLSLCSSDDRQKTLLNELLALIREDSPHPSSPRPARTSSTPSEHHGYEGSLPVQD